ncbi:unnamed protein product [Prorocentrum cordatum]|uniref:Reverse transcriptase domain-containing protein n=1 Tax=Prorocentrum cordatum TaxID=2364126 RepID=A0ABN9UA93_9DINO|nr:unnamed protein product [Polarella glacialis]
MCGNLQELFLNMFDLGMALLGRPSTLQDEQHFVGYWQVFMAASIAWFEPEAQDAPAYANTTRSVLRRHATELVEWVGGPRPPSTPACLVQKLRLMRAERLQLLIENISVTLLLNFNLAQLEHNGRVSRGQNLVHELYGDVSLVRVVFHEIFELGISYKSLSMAEIGVEAANTSQSSGGGDAQHAAQWTQPSAAALVDSMRAELQSAFDRQGAALGSILSNGMGQVQAALAAQKDVAETTARLDAEMRRMGRIIGIMEETRPVPPSPGPAWSRDIDRAVVVVTSKAPIPINTMEGALREVVMLAELDGKFKFEGEEMGTKFFMRMEGNASLALRNLLGRMRIGQGRDLSWRELSSWLPTGGPTPIFLSVDKNGRQVAREIAAKKMRKMVEPVVCQRVFVNPIAPRRTEATLSLNWRQFLQVSVPSPGATPAAQWNARALDHTGSTARVSMTQRSRSWNQKLKSGYFSKFARVWGRAGEVLWQGEEIVPGKILRVAAAYYDDVKEQRGRKVFAHWNVRNFDVPAAVARQVPDIIQGDLGWAALRPDERVVVISGEFNFGDHPGHQNFEFPQHTVARAAHPQERRRAQSFRGAAETVAPRATHWPPARGHASRIDKIFAGWPPWPLGHSAQVAGVHGEPEKLRRQNAIDHGPFWVTWRARPTAARPRDKPAPIAAHIIQHESFKWRIEQYIQACRWRRRRRTSDAARARLLQAAALEVRDLFIRHVSWSKSSVAMIYRQAARALARRDRKMGAMLLERRTWLNEMMEIDEVAGGRPTNAPEIKRRHTLAQRKDANASGAELLRGLEASPGGRLRGQLRALQRRSASWAPPPRRYLGAFLIDGVKTQTVGQLNAGLAAHWGKVVRDPTDARPLMLNNTGAKAIASAADRCLSVAAAKVVPFSQRGFVQHRNFIENVIEMDGLARIASMRSMEARGCHGPAASGGGGPFLFSFDFARAFPSVRRDWIECVLKHWERPSGALELIMIPYADARGLDTSPMRAVMSAIRASSSLGVEAWLAGALTISERRRSTSKVQQLLGSECPGWARFSVASQLEMRATAAAATPFDPTTLLRDYQTKMITALSYKAQMYSLPQALHADEQFVLARLPRASGSLLRRSDFPHLTQLGPPQITPVKAFALASRMRAGATTVSTRRGVASRIDEVAMETLPLPRAVATPWPVFWQVPERSLDLVFLDARHDYEAVAADVVAWRPKVRPGGILSGHDFSWMFPTVAMAVYSAAFDSPERTIHLAPDGVWWLQL